MSVIELESLLKRSIKDFVIYPARSESFTPVGYDVSIGAVAALVPKGGVALSYDAFDSAATPHRISVPPKTALSIVTREKIWLSGRLSGLLFSRGSYAS